MIMYHTARILFPNINCNNNGTKKKITVSVSNKLEDVEDYNLDVV